MAELNSRPGPRDHLHILRRHVLEPLRTAEARAEREREDVARERDAFAEFAARVEDVPTVSPTGRTLPLGEAADATGGQSARRLRRAYAETVMSVPHFEDVYDESLAANVTVEFGEELAQLFDPDSGVRFTPTHRDLLLAAAAQQRRDRDAFCDALEAELDSIRRMRRDLASVLDALDTSIVPVWYRDQFEADVESILDARQSTLYDRSIPASCDGHTLCDHLYHDETWTYPGLTAVAQLLGAVVLREE